MASAFKDNGITNNGLVGISSAGQIGNSNVSVGNSALSNSSNDDWVNGYQRDPRSIAPSWLDWITGYDRQYDNAKYQQWMSDTAIQRRVADAKLAGVNPLFTLSNSSGADSDVSFSNDTAKEGGKNALSAIIKIILAAMVLG